MNTKPVSLADAKGRLAELIAAAKRGEDVVIEDDEHHQVRLVTLAPARKQRVLGLHTGMVDISDDFCAPLPDGFWTGSQL